MKDFIYQIKEECENLKVKYPIQRELPKQMPTPLLREHLYEAIRNLIPYFGVTDKELGRFKRPSIRRVLKPDEHPTHNRMIPAYSPLDNYFYFPMNDRWEYNSGFHETDRSIFCPSFIHHEAGHYLHYAVNPNHIKGTQLLFEKGIKLKGDDELSELVAEYGTIILRLLGPEKYPGKFKHLSSYRCLINLYNEKGPEFLPVLARMSLEDTIKKGIIKI